jgi:formyltetrahydrofolate deformylase
MHAVTGFLFRNDCNIVESRQYEDAVAKVFFLRIRFTTGRASPYFDTLRDDFDATVARDCAMSFRLTDPSQPVKVLIMASKYGHCLNDLLYRARAGEFPAHVVAVVANHPDLAEVAHHYQVPFHHVPVTPETKGEAEQELLVLFEHLGAELVILARYMQILSSSVCTKLDGRAINIHHSMLPSFAGARPYHQAHERGVKLVGATAHYVTPDLDEGPIIEQEVIRIDHTYDPRALSTVGQDAEALALSRAVRWHSEQRVLLNGNSTVVFR